MTELDIPKQQIDFKAFVLRSAVLGDAPKLVTGEFILRSAGVIVAAYIRPDIDFTPLVKALDKIKFSTAARTNGMMSTSRVFGYQPRVAIRRDFCAATGLVRENPKAHEVIEKFGGYAAQAYEALNPEMFAAHRAVTESKVRKEYTLSGLPFTSGIVNQNNPLRYHFDGGNYKDVWSAMIVLKRDIAGGYLAIPEYGITAELPHGGIFLFDGQSVLHGVTPIQRLSKTAMRYTVVYYSMKGMWNCEPMNDEIARIRRLRTERENKRAAK